MKTKSMMPKNVGKGPKGSASPGSDNSSVDKNEMKNQQKGPMGEKVKASPIGAPSTNKHAQRGMTSDDAAKHWPAGYKVPMGTEENHTSSKK
jgi:hypothetical protein